MTNSDQKNPPNISSANRLPNVYILRELPIEIIPNPEETLPSAIAAFFRVKKNKISSIRILRKSLDSRKRNQPLWRYSIEFSFAGTLTHPKAIAVLPKEKIETASSLTDGDPIYSSPLPKSFQPSGNRVAIIGSGPAGMCAALGLARKGYQVQVFEQGNDVGKRFRDIRLFVKGNNFNPYSNILFGEGGAGTFSDGKLTCRTRTPFTDQFLQEWVASGADPEIAYLSHPHIGTDQLQFIIKGFRDLCTAAGCIIHFNTLVDEILTENKRVTGLKLISLQDSQPGQDSQNRNERIEEFDAVVLAAGHSAQVLYRKLKSMSVAMERKPFSVGVRVEHPQELVNHKQLGDKIDLSLVGAAEYFLTWNAPEQGLGGYSFCMCPGGVIVPCADSENGLFTNGMSYSNRAGAFANSAIVIPVAPEDLPGDDILAGIDFIRNLEIKAFALGGGAFTFPAQTIAAYMGNRLDQGAFPKTSFTKPLHWANFRELFPPKIAHSLQETFRNFDQKMPGFISKGFIIGPESRTSSPIRILRDADTLESPSTPGLFPLGEGAGYSGGIVSSGADGFRLAHAWVPWTDGNKK